MVPKEISAVKKLMKMFLNFLSKICAELKLNSKKIRLSSCNVSPYTHQDLSRTHIEAFALCY